MNKPSKKNLKAATKPKHPPSQEPTEQEPAEEDRADWTLGSLIPEFSQTWLTSMAIHTALIVLLAIITMTQVKDDTITLAASPDPPRLESMIEMPLEFEDLEDPVEEEFKELSEPMAEQLLPTETDLVVQSELLNESDFGDLSLDMSTEILVDGDATKGVSEKLDASFFKSGYNEAKRIVYVVDNSNSMTGRDPSANGYGRMETALVELAKSVKNLNSSQQFYIIFYSDTAYGLFHPQTEKRYIAASPKNKKRVVAWLDTIQCCLRTDGKEAFKLARTLKPDLVYILGDGSFTDNAHEILIKNPIEGAVVETRGMKLKGQSAQRFKAIAKAHGGTYRDVGITNEGKAILAKHGPRKPNNTKGPVWGVKLPLKRKKK